jgi:hypothetical protein
VAGFLSSALLILPKFHDLLVDLVGGSNPVPVMLEIWGFITAVIISIYAAVKGYNWVGEWEWEDEIEEPEDSTPEL